MAQRQANPPITGFVVLAALALAGIGYLAWRIYDAPVEPDAAGLVASQATQVTVRAGGGDATMCASMRDLVTPDDADAALQRCREMAAHAETEGPGPLDVTGLRVIEVDVDRNSGRVTVAGTLETPDSRRTTTFTWPVERQDGAWRLAGAPEVKVE